MILLYALAALLGAAIAVALIARVERHSPAGAPFNERATVIALCSVLAVLTLGIISMAVALW